MPRWTSGGRSSRRRESEGSDERAARGREHLRHCECHKWREAIQSEMPLWIASSFRASQWQGRVALRKRKQVHAQSLFRRSLRGRAAAAPAIRSMVFEPSPADGAFGIQSGEVLAILERARRRRALRRVSVHRPGAARRGAQFRRLQNTGRRFRPGLAAWRVAHARPARNGGGKEWVGRLSARPREGGEGECIFRSFPRKRPRLRGVERNPDHRHPPPPFA